MTLKMSFKKTTTKKTLQCLPDSDPSEGRGLLSGGDSGLSGFRLKPEINNLVTGMFFFFKVLKH